MKLNLYQKVAILTIFATLFLIFVGGLVRASGAGLGCPDWPKCFGLWIPPTSIAELPSAFSPDQFNVVKTWTEYVNRLIGVLIGLLITLTMILSVRYRKDRPVITVASVAAFVLVIFQGWLGGMVVRSGLTEWIITIHMLVAMVIVGLLIFAAFEATSTQLMITLKEELRRTMVYASVFLLVVTLMQLVLGTQVREAIDVVSKLSQGIDRGDWLSMVGRVDGIHRSFSWLVLLSSGYLLWFSYAKEMSSYFRRLILGVFALVISQIIIGIVLAYAGMPASFQVLHLLGSAVLISANLFSATSARINP